ncbi:hypothetical protein [Prosthecobacter sp.]|uniref:hypothetical protein n=1 Tax=Prosthecobacter sp. TaxID=1965333 RepID=UPI0037842654
MNTSRKTRCIDTGVMGCLVVLMVAYVGSYFVVLSLPAGIRLPQWMSVAHAKVRPAYVEISGEWTLYPDYRGLPEWFFGPAHYCDRTYLRPGLWSGTNPRNRELSFEWLAGEGTITVTPKSR